MPHVLFNLVSTASESFRVSFHACGIGPSPSHGVLVGSHCKLLQAIAILPSRSPRPLFYLILSGQKVLSDSPLLPTVSALFRTSSKLLGRKNHILIAQALQVDHTSVVSMMQSAIDV